MNALRAILPGSISTDAASRSFPRDPPLPGGVDFSIALSLKMAPRLREARREKTAHTHQVVAGEGQECGELDLPAAAHLRSPQKSDALRPTEGLLDELACLDAQGVSDIAGRGWAFLLRLHTPVYGRQWSHGAIPDEPDDGFRRIPMEHRSAGTLQGLSVCPGTR